MFLSIKFGISVNEIKRLNIMNYKDFFGINEKICGIKRINASVKNQ
ncbi:putative membrane protein [Salmonella phage seszw]|nr:putative membrane protein [Salmonella phage seszw]UCR91336.1 putative membrane protein [Salmonella phage seszw]